ncbi:hypothetical protein PtA15_4A71 [Puccinia triticina]|uniref:Secreted protein n=1 Tax=Puccinia triticina TaxID=208348 RepID=A0ABY7CH17_9BASI|nr:uncharacterized protein PtA15_4A71 [Puccinia triticina]WAQ83623.1 hypothetical protein PtA15_4A71 [Puccinia triticina]
MMFSAKLITALTLVFVASNAVSSEIKPDKMRSQCSQWRAKFGKIGSENAPMMVAKVFNDLDSQKEAVCFDNGYNTKKKEGACLWTGQHQKYDSKKFYPGWVNGEHPTNCNQTLYLINSKKKTFYVPVIDGCAFAEEGQTIDEHFGCSSTYVTRKTFATLGGKADQHEVKIESWNFVDPGGN